MLAGDVAQELGQLAEGGGDLDPLGGAGAAVELAGAVLAVLALAPRGLAGDVAQALQELGRLAVGGDGEAELEVVAAALGADLEPRRRTGPANRIGSARPLDGAHVLEAALAAAGCHRAVIWPMRKPMGRNPIDLLPETTSQESLPDGSFYYHKRTTSCRRTVPR